MENSQLTSPSGKFNLWFIDDDEIVHMIYAALVKQLSLDLTPTYYKDPIEALSKLKDLPGSAWPNLIFLDLNMPIMDGWQFLEEVQKLPYSTRICILTSSIDHRDEKRADQYPIVEDFLRKPLDPKQLRIKVIHEAHA